MKKNQTEDAYKHHTLFQELNIHKVQKLQNYGVLKTNTTKRNEMGVCAISFLDDIPLPNQQLKL